MEPSPQEPPYNITRSGTLSAAGRLGAFLLLSVCHELPGQANLLLEDSLVLTLPLHALQISQHSLSQPLVEKMSNQSHNKEPKK